MCICRVVRRCLRDLPWRPKVGITAGKNEESVLRPAPGSGKPSDRIFKQAERIVEAGLRDPRNLEKMLKSVDHVLSFPGNERMGKKAELEKIKKLLEKRLSELIEKETKKNDDVSTRDSDNATDKNQGSNEK
ncbi:hypothetical protein [Aestuariivirga sp.]|uniref:hypothetical protein n=1 Tax=Aestuariivirga sp. TaxID=2650926 RepID=UPI003BADA080